MISPTFAVNCSDLLKLATGKSYKNAKWAEYSNGAKALLLERVGSKRAGSSIIWKAILYTKENPEGVIVALRLPRDKTFITYLEQTVRGYELLSQTEITIPKLISYSLREYVAMEFIPHRFSLVEVFDHPERFTEKRERFLFDKFIEFARKTYQWETIPDFHALQIAYDHVRERWVYLDWAYPESIVRYRSTTQSEVTLFGNRPDFGFNFIEDSFLDQGQKSLIQNAHEAALEMRSRGQE